MSLTLYYHPLASFCHKVLIALSENKTPFAAEIVDLGKRGGERPVPRPAADARDSLATAYGMLERRMADRMLRDLRP